MARPVYFDQNRSITGDAADPGCRGVYIGIHFSHWCDQQSFIAKFSASIMVDITRCCAGPTPWLEKFSTITDESRALHKSGIEP